MPPHILLRDLILFMFDAMPTQSLTEWDSMSHPAAHIGEQCPVCLSGTPHGVFLSSCVSRVHLSWSSPWSLPQYPGFMMCVSPKVSGPVWRQKKGKLFSLMSDEKSTTRIEIDAVVLPLTVPLWDKESCSGRGSSFQKTLHQMCLCIALIDVQ